MSLFKRCTKSLQEKQDTFLESVKSVPAWKVTWNTFVIRSVIVGLTTTYNHEIFLDKTKAEEFYQLLVKSANFLQQDIDLSCIKLESYDYINNVK